MTEQPLALVVGANRGIGFGVVKELLAQGHTVIATARQPARAHDLAAVAAANPGRVEILPLDLLDAAQIDGFASAVQGRTFDLVLINAGVAGPDHRSADRASVTDIGELMVVNATAPIKLARLLTARIRARTGVLGFTSSVMGSVALNSGGHELYRASKAALNSLSRGLWGEIKGRGLTLLSLHPGWVRTDLGGSSAPVSIEDSARGLVAVMRANAGAHRHAFIDYKGAEIAW